MWWCDCVVHGVVVVEVVVVVMDGCLLRLCGK